MCKYTYTYTYAEEDIVCTGERPATLGAGAGGIGGGHLRVVFRISSRKDSPDGTGRDLCACSPLHTAFNITPGNINPGNITAGRNWWPEFCRHVRSGWVSRKRGRHEATLRAGRGAAFGFCRKGRARPRCGGANGS